MVSIATALPSAGILPLLLPSAPGNRGMMTRRGQSYAADSICQSVRGESRFGSALGKVCGKHHVGPIVADQGPG